MIGKDFIKKYIEYGLQSWFNSDSEYTQKQNVRFSWVFGKTAIKRWDALPAELRSYYVKTQLKKDYGVAEKAKRSTRLSSLLTKVRPIEEKFKSEYLNSPRGLLWCKANTTLYLHRSPSCTVCNYKDECKEILRINMPHVYKLRGYDK